MIEGFRHKGLKRLHENDDRRLLPPDMVLRIRVLLAALETARAIGDMNRPSFGLHPLKGQLKDFWSVTVRANWRISFRFEEGHAFDIDFVDYH